MTDIASAAEEPTDLATQPVQHYRRSVGLMALGTTISRLTGFARVFAIAYALGFSRLTDAYNLANTTPNIVYELMLGGVLSATLVPVFISRTKDDDASGWRSISAVITLAIALLAVASVLLTVFAGPIIDLYMGSSGGGEKPEASVGTSLLQTFAPQVLLYGIVTITTALCQMKRRFGPPMFTPILNNVVVIGVLLAFPHISSSIDVADVASDRGAVLWLGIGTTLGVVVMAGAMIWFVRDLRSRIRPRWHLRDPAIGQILRLSGWTFGFVAANQVALWVVLYLANETPGGVSAYQAAYIFFILPNGILAVSVMTALLPELSTSWAQSDSARFRQQATLGMRSIVAFMVPAAVGLIVVALPLVDTLLRHGALTTESAEVCGEILRLMAIGLPGFAVFLYCVRIFQSTQNTRSPFVLYVFQNGVNVALCIWLNDKYGVTGLGLALAISYTLAGILALAWVRVATKGLSATGVAVFLFKIVVCSAALGAITWLALQADVGSGPLQTVVACLLGATVFVGAAFILRIQEITSMLPLTRRR